MNNPSKHNKIAILICCFNRKQKTLACLESIFCQNEKDRFQVDIYLVDDGSDGTSDFVNQTFSSVISIEGNGSLFWTGGMRVAWHTALQSGIDYDFFLLLNDDTVLFEDALKTLLKDYFSLNSRKTIIVGTTLDSEKNVITYGGRLLKNSYNLKYRTIVPNGMPQICDLGNGNIMLIPKCVVEKIGILSEDYTHGIADYDYTLRAKKAGIPSYVASQALGLCNDNGHNWLTYKSATLKRRVQYLVDVKGLAYEEYLKFIRIHFPFYYVHAWVLLWTKTLFPFLWDRFKTNTIK